MDKVLIIGGNGFVGGRLSQKGFGLGYKIAVADIDKAEKNKELSYRVNVEGAANCAKAAKRIGAKYIWFSSDAVFDGMGRDYTEECEVNPVNYYGRCKRLGEEAILEINNNSIIIRISLILGIPVSKGNLLLAGLISRMKAGQTIACST